MGLDNALTVSINVVIGDADDEEDREDLFTLAVGDQEGCPEVDVVAEEDGDSVIFGEPDDVVLKKDVDENVDRPEGVSLLDPLLVTLVEDVDDKNPDDDGLFEEVDVSESKADGELVSEELDESVVQDEIVAILENVGDAVELALCEAQLLEVAQSVAITLFEAKLFEAD